MPANLARLKSLRLGGAKTNEPAPTQPKIGAVKPNYGPDAFKNRAESLAGQAYKAKDVSGPIKEFDFIRGRVAQQSRANEQEQQDAIKRRFARMGGLNTGAFIKQQGLAQQQSQQQRSEALQGVDFQEQQERARRQEVESQREFASQEANINRLFAGSEAAVGRQFQAGESQAGRDMQRNLAQADLDFKNQVFNFEQGTKLKELDLAERQFNADRADQEFNKLVSGADLNVEDAFKSMLALDPNNPYLRTLGPQVSRNRLSEEERLLNLRLKP